MASAYDFELRLLACPKCGAALEIPREGGNVTCKFCGAPSVFVRRDAVFERARKSAPKRPPPEPAPPPSTEIRWPVTYSLALIFRLGRTL